MYISLPTCLQLVLLKEENHGSCCCHGIKWQPCVAGLVGWNSLMSYLLNNPHNTLRIFSLLQKELQNLEDAGDELMMLDDDTTPIPYPFSNFYHIYLLLQFK